MGSRASDRPILELVVDRQASRQPLLAWLPDAIEAGIDWVQVRDRALSGRDLLNWSKEVAAAIGGDRLLINRRIDVALCVGARGVQLGFNALSARDARALLGDSAAIGVSTHAPQEVAVAAADGASFAQLAPIFSPFSKASSRPTLGLAELSHACTNGIPVLAQGGIDAARAAQAVAAGAAGVAVSGAILMAEDPVATTRTLRSALDSASRS